jgi:nitrate reductase gamma subunit
MGGLQVLFYISTLVFVVGVIYKGVRLARMPLHLRWDLYPIPHEGGGRGAYGGSYFEEVDWWTKPANIAISNEIKEAAKEILFIQSMYHNNRPLWMFSFPFHFGLYLSIAFVALIYIGAILGLLGTAVTVESTSFIGRAVYHLTWVFGLSGAVLAGLGAVGLFFSRIFRRELRRTSVWTDYFNVALLAAVFATTLWTWATVDPTFAATRAFAAGLIAFKPVPAMEPIAYVHYMLAALFLLWLPFTHMTHFVGKYFTYHKVRWEDHPNLQGSKMERAVVEALGYKIKWSAPHIKSGGSWAEAATDAGSDEGDKNE